MSVWEKHCLRCAIKSNAGEKKKPVLVLQRDESIHLWSSIRALLNCQPFDNQ